MKLLITDTFPTISVRTTKGDFTLPEAFAGHWFVFFSHPGDFTPVCTTEFVAFQQRANWFAAIDTKLIGLSVDGIGRHRAWIDWIDEHLDVDIEFPIIDDSDRAVSLALGMLRPDQTASATARSVIVVDGHGVVRTILEYPKELGRSIDEIVRIVEGLQLHDATGLMTPADWPDNETIGAQLLVSPAAELSPLQVADQHVTQLSEWFRYRPNPMTEVAHV